VGISVEVEVDDGKIVVVEVDDEEEVDGRELVVDVLSDIVELIEVDVLVEETVVVEVVVGIFVGGVKVGVGKAVVESLGSILYLITYVRVQTSQSSHLCNILWKVLSC